jgi:predicted transcriptional regulator
MQHSRSDPENDAMSTTLTIRLDEKLDRALTRFARRTGRPKSELAREALRRQLAMARFEEARRVVLPFAEARGLLTDEDVFAAVS